MGNKEEEKEEKIRRQIDEMMDRFAGINRNGFKYPPKESLNGCTVLLSLGTSSANGHCLVAENRDVASIGSPEIMVLGKPKDGNRYLGISTSANPSSLTIGINEKGVISGMAARYCGELVKAGVSAGAIIQRCLPVANSAREMAAKIEEMIHARGKNRNGSAFSCADSREAYVVEAYKKKSEVFGPLKDTLFTYGNYALTEKIKSYEKNVRGHARAKRARKLMAQYAGNLTVPFLIRFCRDHEYPPDLVYTWDDRNICTHGFGTDTRGSGVCVAHRKYPGLLSAVWSAFNHPCKTPYVPFYVGITRIPEVYAGPKAYNTFEALALALEENPEFKRPVRQCWEAFEYQILREGCFLEKKAAQLADSDRMNEAQKMLTDFVTDTAMRAVADAQNITRKMQRNQLLSHKVIESRD